MRPFILHAHFYQPERLNPWTGALDPEPSAAPDRDWNARILRECYGPNGAARIFDQRRRVERIVNNYERLSFNFGPTLLSWLEHAAPRTYAKVLDGDFRSAVRLGHGNAIAQAFNHMILPLANERDRRTQIAWGMADFRHRFRREPEGMWLPEAAIDQATVDALIDAGIRFTVLAPSQAGRVQEPDGTWRDANGDIDTSIPYRLRHSDGSGRWMAAFFYDGGLAQGFAFDPATTEASVIVERLKAAGGDGLVHAALDGETFGHHHAFGELGLAYALYQLAEREGLEPVNYASFLEQHPPTRDAEVVAGEGSAWSCAHGVGRWYRDCGCSTDALPGWNQEWREPLRRALNVVRDAALAVYEERAGALLKDPWAARDDYILVRLGELARGDFLDRHAIGTLDESRRTDVWTLLESQRNAMVMYTSCGWFFADVSGIETVYVLRSAARVLGLLEELGAATPRAQVLEILAEARSNKPGGTTGADIWRNQVAADEVTPTRVAAHLALTSVVRPLAEVEEAGGHGVHVTDLRSEQRGRVGLATARFHVQSLATSRHHDFTAAAVHLGGLDFHGVVAETPPHANGYDLALDALWDEFPTAPLARLLNLVTDLLDGDEFDLEQALPEGRREIVSAVFSELGERFREVYERLYTDNRRILEMLTAAGYELPRDLRAAAELTLSGRLEQILAGALGEAGVDDEALDEVREILTLARSQGYELDLTALERLLTQTVSAAARAASQTLQAGDIDAVERWLALCGELAIDIDLSEAQEHAYDAAVRARTGRLNLEQRERAERLGTLLGLSPLAWSPRP